MGIEGLGKLSCLRGSLLHPVQKNLGREVRVNMLNVQLLQGPSQGIENVLKITGSFVRIFWLCSWNPWLGGQGRGEHNGSWEKA